MASFNTPRRNTPVRPLALAATHFSKATDQGAKARYNERW